MRRTMGILCALVLGRAALADDGFTLTYVVGSGYLLRRGDLGIAIDALVARDVPPDTRARMAAADAPFDVDLILVTHSDPDHFDAGIAGRNLQANPHALLIGPADVVRAVQAEAPALSAARCIVANPRPDSAQRVDGTGFTVEIFAVPHSLRNPQNVGYRLSLAGLVLAHSGDPDVRTAAADFTRTGFDRVTVDVMIIPYYFFSSSYRNVLARCPSRLYVPTHASPSQLSFAYAPARATPHKILCFSRPLETAELAPTPKE